MTILASSSIYSTNTRRFERRAPTARVLLLQCFLLFDRAAGFLPPRPQISHAAARRAGQGRPALRRYGSGVSRPRHEVRHHAHAPRTDCGVDGTYASRSTAASRSSPAAAQRCAEGAGLDGGDRGRSTIERAVHRTADTKLHRCHDPRTALPIPREFTPLDGRDPRHRSVGAKWPPAASAPRISARPVDNFKPVVFDQFHAAGDTWIPRRVRWQRASQLLVACAAAPPGAAGLP